MCMNLAHGLLVIDRKPKEEMGEVTSPRGIGAEILRYGGIEGKRWPSPPTLRRSTSENVLEPIERVEDVVRHARTRSSESLFSGRDVLYEMLATLDLLLAHGANLEETAEEAWRTWWVHALSVGQ